MIIIMEGDILSCFKYTILEFTWRGFWNEMNVGDVMVIRECIQKFPD